MRRSRPSPARSWWCRVDNARYALNAANARWVSLYDALYGTDAILPVDHGAKGYDTARGARVIAYARALLDEIAPLQSGSHADSIGYAIKDGQLQVSLKDGGSSGLREPSRYVGWRGTPAQPTAVLLKNNGLHVEISIDRSHRIGSTDRRGRGRPHRRSGHHRHPGLRGFRRRRGCPRQDRRLPQLAGPDERHARGALRQGRRHHRAQLNDDRRYTDAARQRTHPARPQPDAGAQCRAPHAHRCGEVQRRAHP